MYSDVELVKSRTNITDIIGEYVKLTKAGSRFKACCPFHQEKTPSFVVNEDRQTYHCFGCGQGGDVFSFVMEMENMGFREALTLLAEKSGVELQNNFTPTQRESGDLKKRMYDALELATQFYEKQLWDGMGKKQALSYIKDRGISDETIKKFRLGFAPAGWNHIEKFLLSKGYDHAVLTAAGLVIKKELSGEDHGNERYYDRFRERIIFPIRDPLGRVIGFTARVMPGGDERQGKYINTPESLLYHKSSVLYGIDLAKQAIKQNDVVVVVEGNMDVIASHNADIHNVVAVSGTAMTEEHIRLLKRFTRNLILFFDADQAGVTAARRSAIACLSADLQIRMVLLQEGKDAADRALQNPDKLRTDIAQAKNAIMVFMDIAQKRYDMKDPHGKRQVIEFIAELVAHIFNDIERDEWVARCAEHLDIGEKVFRNTMAGFMPQVQKSVAIQQRVMEHISISEEEHSQMQRIYRSIILMMMAYPHVWEYLYKNRERYGPIMEQKNISELIREGPECGFSIGDFVHKDSRREALYKAAMKMQQVYEMEREDGGSPIDDTETYIAIALETIHQRKIDQLLLEMKKAEEDGNYDEQRRILTEINTLSQNIIHNS